MRNGFTVGSGFKVGSAVSIDISAGYSMSKYYHHDLFPDSWLDDDYEDRSDRDLVCESQLYGVLGINFEY